MHRVIYASRATAPLSEADLVSLLAQARQRNTADGITGMLLYAGGSFLQALEGDEQPVRALLDRIRVDERHTELRLLADGEAGARDFGDWSMGFDAPDDLSLSERLPGYTPATRYPLVNPDLVLDGTVARSLLQLYARNAA